MKKLFLLIAVFLFTVNVNAQSFFWGKQANTKIPWFSSFKNNEYILGKVTQTQLCDSISSGILYTQMIPIPEDSRGVYAVWVSLDSSDSPMDSAAQLYFRFYADKDVHPYQYWDIWHQIGGYFKTDSLYSFDFADSSWWKAASGGQFKIDKYDADDDTCTVNLGINSN